MNVKDKIPKSVRLKTYLLSLTLISLIFIGAIAYVASNGGFTAPNVYLDDIPSDVSYVVKTDGSYFWAVRYDGKIPTGMNGTNDDLVIQYAVDNCTANGGTVYVKAGTYSASVTLKDNVTLRIEKGATGITVSVNAGATCWLEDYNGATKYFYSSGSLVWKEDLVSGEFWWNSQNRTDTLQHPEASYSYMISMDGSVCKAKNGSTGQIDYSGTDASTVIQSTINDSTDGENIFIKTGVYEILTSILVKSNVGITGAGRKNTILRRIADVPILRFYEKDGISENQENNLIENIGLDGRYGYSYTSNLIEITQLKDSIFRNLDLFAYRGNGIYIKGVSGAKSFWNTFEDILLEGDSNYNTGAAIYVDSYAIDSWLYRITAGYHKYGMYFNGSAWYLNDFWPVHCENALYIKKSGLRGERIVCDTCRGDSIYIDSSANDVQHIHLSKIHFIDPPAGYSLIYINVSSGCFCRDNFFSDLTGFGSTYAYIIDKEGSGTFDRTLINGVFMPTGASGRYNNVEPSFIIGDPRYITENSGTATNSTATTFVFNHGLAWTPTGVWASFNTTEITGWTWTATSTEITITVVGITANRTCYWTAEYKP